MSKRLGGLLIVLAFALGSLPWIISTFFGSNAQQEHRVFFKDENGGNLIHVTSTPQGDLWIYNAGDQEVYYLDNPKESNKIKIMKQKLFIE